MIRYKKYQNLDKKSPYYEKWYARAVCEETVDLKALASHMANHNTPYSAGCIHGVLTDMTACIKELLLEGKNVKIGDLAILSVGIQTKAADAAKDFTATANITGVRLRCRATGRLSTANIKKEALFKEYSEYDSGTVAAGE